MKQRVITAVVLAPMVLAATLCTLPWPLVGLAALVAVLSYRELSGLLRIPSGIPVASTSILLAAVAFLELGKPFQISHVQASLTGAALMAVGVVATLFASLQRIGGRFVADVANLWSVGPLVCLVAMHDHVPSTGHLWTLNPILMAILPIWGGDIAAIVVGRYMGRHPLAPTISPKKTVEGAIANLITCVIVSLCLAPVLSLPLHVGIPAGVACGILGQAGDLFESWVKRRAGQKDSGSLLPGHGGILDRIDSLLFAVPVVTLILLLLQP